MEVVTNNYLPGDQRLVEKIVYELKSQGIFDQFRKECFADVDTKPAYQNLRQRVEGSVTGFLKEQSWRPDMNKNQVREMLRRTITESGFLETGVERIVDQVVNPKINSIFLPKVEEVVYSYLGIKKPNRNDPSKSDQSDLLPTDLEAVSPESEPVDKKDDKSTDNIQEMEESKTEEDESPPFEPLDEQSLYVTHEENSIDSHLSGFSGLISHESNQSNENKVSQMELESQVSRNSSDSRLSIVTSDENSKMDICEDSQSKSIKSSDSNHKHDDKNKHKSSDRHKSRSDSKSDKDKKNSKDSKARHNSSSNSSKDKDKSRDRKDSKSSNKNDKDKDKPKDKNDKDRSKSSSNSKYSSNNKDKPVKKDSSRSEKDKGRSSSSHKDSKTKDKSSDSKSKEKFSSSDKHKHSSSSHSDRHKKDKDRKKDAKSKDDHYSLKDKKNDRRSTDRDSNDGQSSKQNLPNSSTESSLTQTQKPSQESGPGASDSGNSDQVEATTKAPIIITGAIENSEITIASAETQRVKVLKPKCASNIHEALRLMKIRKQLARLEKQNQLSLASVDVNTPILLSSSISLDDLKHNGLNTERNKQEDLNSKIISELEVVPSPLQNTIISQDNWDAMEAKLRQEVCSEFGEFNDESFEESNNSKIEKKESQEECKYFDRVDIKQIEFLQFVEQFIKRVDRYRRPMKEKMCKRKLEDNDLKNNNNQKLKIIPEKKRKIIRKSREINSVTDIVPNEKFSLPLSPAESDKSVDKKDETIITPLKTKRNSISKASNQRYSSDDLYKPRPTFTNSRRRGAKNLEN